MQPQQQQQPIPAPAPSSIPRSRTSSASASIPPRYTPPSPTRYENSSFGSVSPEPQFADPAISSTKDKLRPGRRESNPSPPPTMPEDSASRTRPRPVRVPTAVDETETTLEKIWQPLFDAQDKPTLRLSQFLRGLAVHIIEDCEPKGSIVITPYKMLRFLESSKVADEVYPWSAIFGGKMTCASISRLYRDLKCQHHFVQHINHETPYIPALTPCGFKDFMTILILAHPDLEYERLAKAVLDMPISNADNPKERFPKELSRRLLPKTSDLQSRQRLTAAMSADPVIKLRSSDPLPPPPPVQPPQMPISGSFTERERMPYSNSFSSSAVDDEDLQLPSVPIERERKPYTAKEGSGKIYEDSNRVNPSLSNSYRSDTSAPRRASTAIPFTQSGASKPTESIPFPTSSRSHRTSSSANGVPRPNMNMYSASPSTSSNPYTRSEGSQLNDIPAAYYASNIHDDVPDPRRYSRRDDVARGYGFTSSSVPNAGYDYGTGLYDERRRGPGGSDGYGSFPGYPPPPGARY